MSKCLSVSELFASWGYCVQLIQKLAKHFQEITSFFIFMHYNFPSKCRRGVSSTVQENPWPAIFREPWNWPLAPATLTLLVFLRQLGGSWALVPSAICSTSLAAIANTSFLLSLRHYGVPLFCDFLQGTPNKILRINAWLCPPFRSFVSPSLYLL